MSEKQRIVVAMSGGVDSSAAAALLHEQGHEVIGVTLKLYDASGTSASIGGRCCSPRDIDDARQVAAHLGIPYYVLDEVEAFQAAVVANFVSEYRVGHTPNPCVRCNERIKFGPLLAFADAVGAARLATGHYARLERTAEGTRLLRAVDLDKDQSYFLFGVRPDWLARIEFPVGHLHKADVRAAARRAGLPNSDKPDSNQICFIPDGDHKAFLDRNGGGGKPGVIVDENGHTLATHEGTHHFTLGQRKGLPAFDGQARFVLRIDGDTGTVHTGPRPLLGRHRIRVGDVRWLGDAPAAPLVGRVQIRHRGEAFLASLTPLAGDPQIVEVQFTAPVEGGAPGQAAVFYDGEVVRGGGWIIDEPLIALRRGRAEGDAVVDPG